MYSQFTGDMPKNRLVSQARPLGIPRRTRFPIPQAAASERRFSYLFGNADIVCTGTIIENDRKAFAATLSLDSLLKGALPHDPFTMNYKAGFDVSSKAGAKLLLFLKETTSGIRLFSGPNSIYEIDGNRLLRSRRLPLITTLDEIQGLRMPGQIDIFKIFKMRDPLMGGVIST